MAKRKKKTPYDYGLKYQLNIGDYIKLRFVYRDRKTGRFLSKKQIERLKKKDPNRIMLDVLPYLKKRLPGVYVKSKKGKPMKKKDYKKVLEAIKKHNMALSMAVRRNITYHNAYKIVDKAFKAYNKGLVSSAGFKKELGY
jgi:hypothetical protein